METIARTREVMPDSTLSKGASALAASLLMVEPELVWGLIAVVLLNAIASLWYGIRSDDRTALTVVRWLILRIGVYLLVMPSVVILSRILGVEMIQRTAFAAAAGWEVAVTLGLGARLSPRFRPVYETVVKAIDENTPADLTEDDVTDAIDRDTDSNA